MEIFFLICSVGSFVGFELLSVYVIWFVVGYVNIVMWICMLLMSLCVRYVIKECS